MSLAFSRPQVIQKMIDGELHEPFEWLTVDVEEAHQGAIMSCLGERRGELQSMQPDGKGRIRLDYILPARALIGLHSLFLTLTSGSGLMHHVFDHYGKALTEPLAQRPYGALIANGPGKASGFALWNIQERGRLFIGPKTEVYEGMVIGRHSRSNDLVVNAIKGKQLTNIRASGSDDAIVLTPPLILSLEQALSFIDDDELVEVTPNHIRLRKRFLKAHERKRSQKTT